MSSPGWQRAKGSELGRDGGEEQRRFGGQEEGNWEGSTKLGRKVAYWGNERESELPRKVESIPEDGADGVALHVTLPQPAPRGQ